jgi:hypothetical protein
MDDSTVNSQITDSVSQSSAATIGQAAAESFAILDVVMAETLGMGMHNAVSAQHGMQLVSSAAVTATCARMLGAEGPTVVVSPSTSPAPQASPLSGPLDPSAIINSASAEAQKAIAELKKNVDSATKNSSAADTALNNAQKALSELSNDDSKADDKKADDGTKSDDK